jgi:hypothetical protein
MRIFNMPKKTIPLSIAGPDLESSPANPANQASVNSHPNGGSNYEEVKRLAHEYWHARGCPEGSPEEDWFRAEQAVNGSAE